MIRRAGLTDVVVQNKWRKSMMIEGKHTVANESHTGARKKFEKVASKMPASSTQLDHRDDESRWFRPDSESFRWIADHSDYSSITFANRNREAHTNARTDTLRLSCAWCIVPEHCITQLFQINKLLFGYIISQAIASVRGGPLDYRTKHDPVRSIDLSRTPKIVVPLNFLNYTIKCRESLLTKNFLKEKFY